MKGLSETSNTAKSEMQEWEYALEIDRWQVCNLILFRRLNSLFYNDKMS